ncbi:hypothetical protein ScPMuIL_018006 [Solemya velum]
MEYRSILNSDVKVSNICLGTMTFGSSPHGVVTYQCPSQSDEDKAHSILNRFAELGGNYIDTADRYSFGNAESILGKWLGKQSREKFVIASKVGLPSDPNHPLEAGLSRRRITECIDRSLERLRTNYLDIYQMHLWSKETPIEESLLAMNDLVRCGKVKSIGSSNLCGWQLQKIVDVCHFMGLSKLATLQQQYNLLCRHSELEVFPVCEKEGISILPWSPLKGGYLTGKFKRGANVSSDGSRVGFVARNESRALESTPAWSKMSGNDSYWKLIDLMRNIAENHDKTIAQVAIRWLLQKDVTSVVIGATSVSQLESNVGAATGWALTESEMSELNEESTITVAYPYKRLL